MKNALIFLTALLKMSTPQKLLGVNGYLDRKNDLLYCPPLQTNNKNTKNIVAYFGGDIQDFTENMKKSSENNEFIDWSLDNVALLLQSAFPKSHIMVVRPNRIEKKTFSCYDNFVTTLDKYGVPDHSFHYGALEHLEKLVTYILALDKEKLHSSDADPRLAIAGTVDEKEKFSLTIMGFSKGCIVLNQILYEFHYWSERDNLAMKEFIGTITDMYWLDGGHNGGHNIWVTSKNILQTLTNLGINIHVHISPYQVRDPRRPWIGAEEEIFSNKLQSLGAPINRTLHFEKKAPDINNHFNVIKVAIRK